MVHADCAGGCSQSDLCPKRASAVNVDDAEIRVWHGRGRCVINLVQRRIGNIQDLDGSVHVDGERRRLNLQHDEVIGG